MLYRYEVVSSDNLNALNRLLSKGWRPVRESLLAADSQDSAQQFMILLEKEGVSAGSAVVKGVDVTDVADVPLLTGLSTEELEEVLNACDVAEYQSGDIIFANGEKSCALYIVLAGEISISVSGEGEEELEITQIVPQTAFGESSFFAQGEHSGTAQCVQAARVLRLGRDHYQALLESGSGAPLKVAENAAESLASALRTANEWILELLNEQAAGETALSWQKFRHRIRHGHFG